MSDIVATHILPYCMQKNTILSSITTQVISDGENDQVYYPVGATIAVNTNERKFRFIEHVNNAYIERYCLITEEQRAINDMDVLFMRIFDGGVFAKYLINRSGIQRVLKDWRAFVDDNAYCGRSLFANDLGIYGNDRYLEILTYDVPQPCVEPQHTLSRFYQSDLSGKYDVIAPAIHPTLAFNEYLSTRSRSIITGVPLELLTGSTSLDEVCCDTGKVAKIDYFSWLTKEGDLAASTLKPCVSSTNRWLTLEEEDHTTHKTHMLSLQKHYDVAHLLQLSCLTDIEASYILLNRKIAFLPDVSSVLCRYANVAEKEILGYLTTLGSLLFKHWPGALRITVVKTWQNDAYLTIVYGHTNITYYVDLTIFALLTRSLSHL